jgi:hypothetical protein
MPLPTARLDPAQIIFAQGVGSMAIKEERR